MTSCCLYAQVVNNIWWNFNLFDFQTQGYARILYAIRDLHKGCGFIFPVCFLYHLNRFPIHEYLFILCIAYLLLCIFNKGVSWNSRFTSTDHVSVIDKYYFYHGLGLKAFEGRHIIIQKKSPCLQIRVLLQFASCQHYIEVD